MPLKVRNLWKTLREDELRDIEAKRGVGWRERHAEAVRGTPDFTLEEWAETRGMRYRGNTVQMGYLLATCPWSVDLVFNIVRGSLPGGVDGVLCHENRLYTASEGGRFEGGMRLMRTDSNASKAAEALTLGVSPFGSEGYFKAPFTTAGARVAHFPVVRGLHVARRRERSIVTSALPGKWESLKLDGHGLPGWVAGIRDRSDHEVVDRLLRGPIHDVLSREQGLGFEIRMEYGQLVISRQLYLRDAELDDLATTTGELAIAIGEMGLIAAPPTPFATELPPPRWLETVRANPGEPCTAWPIGARVEKVAAIAAERGMTLEDPGAFHQAFPQVTIPGEAFAVMRGRLPGVEGVARMACCAERPMIMPQEVRKLTTDPGGRVGCDIAVLPAPAGARPTGPDGELHDGTRVIVHDGVVVARRARDTWQANGPALDRLAADALRGI
jgi:hypothetical protein